MKFPISIEIIDDEIVLFLGQITPEFKRELNNVNLGSSPVLIRSNGSPQLGGNIYVNGTKLMYNYTIARSPYSENKYNEYINTINKYKKKLGYDE